MFTSRERLIFTKKVNELRIPSSEGLRWQGDRQSGRNWVLASGMPVKDTGVLMHILTLSANAPPPPSASIAQLSILSTDILNYSR